MTVRTSYLLAAAVALGIARPVPAQQPFPNTPNQQIADTIAGQLRQSPQLHGYTIDVIFQNGMAELRGQVADAGQSEAAQRIVQNVPGVYNVRNRLVLANGLMRTQAEMPAPVPPLQGAPPLPAVPNGGPPLEPAPMFMAPAPGGYATPPAMPPYAWPTYAPYNNFSRVAYPTAYPYNAWPFIGPCYPFPKIPLSWRSVKLEWEDGHWWLGPVANKQDWWRLRYW